MSFDFTPTKDFDVDHLLSTIAKAEALASQTKSSSPRQFTFGKNTYIHLPNTETFYTPNTPLDENGDPLETLTALKIMKANFEPTRSYRRRINILNPQFFLFGDSARFKIIRMVQAHFAMPPITDETNQWTPFFQFLSTDIEDHWTVQQQYSSCKWACPNDEAAATSLLLHYGWAPKYQIKMGAPCIYRIRATRWGISITTNPGHNFNTRLQAACVAAADFKIRLAAYNKKPQFNDLNKVALRTFFSYDKWYVSIPADYRQAIINKIQAYCQHLTDALADAEPELPTIDEPEEILELEDDACDLLWEDFEFDDKVSDAKSEQLRDIAINKTLKTLMEKTATLDLDGEYTYAELMKYITDNNFTSAKAKNFIVPARKEGRKTFWKLNYERS